MSDAPANPETQPAAEENPQAQKLEGSTYEILRNRLKQRADELRERLDLLNSARKDVFGSIDFKLISTERITTEHNCVPRDMVAVGNHLLFGYNVKFGLKKETHPGDVFALYNFENNAFHVQPLDLIGDETFDRDFREIYRYYKHASFSRFASQGPFLYMVFQIGERVDDLKVFKWQNDGGKLTYIDNRSEHELKDPPQHEFSWTRTTREQHVKGTHPHISIDDRVFVETVGGDLTIKIENNTESGQGIYAEPVDNKDQVLDDAEIYYTIIGNLIVFKIRPYQEKAFRHIVFNSRTNTAQRIDAIAQACVLLPDDQGLIFPNGFYLQTGEYKTFEAVTNRMTYEGKLVAPNGEDFLYVFFEPEIGDRVLLPYNLIELRVDTPLNCNGFTRFDGGELVAFKRHGEAQKHHAVQIWQTPFVDEAYSMPTQHQDSLLFKVGNREIVRAMAECNEILALIRRKQEYDDLYVDLVRRTTDVIDSYFWIDNDDAANLSEPLKAIQEAATAAIDEFEKVARLRKNTADKTQAVQGHVGGLLRDANHRRYETIGDFVTVLSELRRARGEIISLKDLRYVNEATIEELEKQVVEAADRTAHRCVDFLLRDDALNPYRDAVVQQTERIEPLEKVADGEALGKEIDKTANELEMLIEVVGNLKIDDATQRTAIIDSISTIFSKINTARASLKNKIKSLMSVEGAAEFRSQMKLLDQSVVGFLDVCESPEACDEYLTRIMVQLEELEGRFAEFDEFIVELAEKRDEVYNAFETRKLALVEQRNKRAQSLGAAADRILTGISSRIQKFDDVTDIHAYFASDLMIEKVRGIVDQLEELNDASRVDDIQSRLKNIREDAVRQLKDKQELFVGGENVIKFGKHQFNVTTQAIDLTSVLRDGELQLHLTGTRFFEPIEDPELLATKSVWAQEVVSENRRVYRAEYLAYLIFKDLNSSGGEIEIDVERFLQMTVEDQAELVQKFASPRYQESYTKGVHDHDATKILAAIVELNAAADLLRFDTSARAMAWLYWHRFASEDTCKLLHARLRGLGNVARVFKSAIRQAEYKQTLEQHLADFVEQTGLFSTELIPGAAEYLIFEQADDSEFIVSRAAANLHERFTAELNHQKHWKDFESSVAELKSDPKSQFILLRDWLSAFLAEHAEAEDEAEFIDEAACLLLRGKISPQAIADAQLKRTLEGLVGSHPRINDGKMEIRLNEFLLRLYQFETEDIPRFNTYVERKKEVLEEGKERLKLDEFKPRVLSSFVRNRLIDSVYLPLIGDNLAKQIGSAGEDKRTDRMGLLLLVSPPGYGKTTLMEYIANRLGIVFMKINGPAIGHEVTSLDPAAANNASARDEVEKLNLALEMGDNVMIYLDDIQHCNPEFLQKFISLCDAQRKIEGVYRGRSQTYDLRGRKVAVVMAGNPYTESGEKFQIPDMLANRADIYNLGEIIGETAEAFEMSYLENALTSNPTLSGLATRSQKDIQALISAATTGDRESLDLEGNISPDELNDYMSVLEKLVKIRDVVLDVNREYIRSAAMSDDYRTEPPFKLQGSYRNMNRMAEKVAPIMNAKELQSLIVSSYENDVQTLTSDAEGNLLKFKELMGIQTPQEQERWADIKKTFKKNIQLKGMGGDDKTAQVMLQLSNLSDGLDKIGSSLQMGSEKFGSERAAELEALRQGISDIVRAVSAAGDKLARPVAAAADDEMPASKRDELLAEILNKLADQDAFNAVDDGESELKRVIVQHKVPRSILDVLQSQFSIMQNWLAPLTESHRKQIDSQAELKSAVEACLTRYNELIEEMEDARKRR